MEGPVRRRRRTTTPSNVLTTTPTGTTGADSGRAGQTGETPLPATTDKIINATHQPTPRSPVDRGSVTVEEGKPWTPRQLEKARAATEPTLFDENGLVELQPVPYRIKFRYKCEESGCNGHNQELIDWELGAAGLYWPRRYGDKTLEMIKDKWSGMVDSSTKDVHFYVGNQHQRRETFSVCGIWHPPL